MGFHFFEEVFDLNPDFGRCHKTSFTTKAPRTIK